MYFMKIDTSEGTKLVNPNLIFQIDESKDKTKITILYSVIKDSAPVKLELFEDIDEFLKRLSANSLSLYGKHEQ